jgi:hypothetical protein
MVVFLFPFLPHNGKLHTIYPVLGHKLPLFLAVRRRQLSEQLFSIACPII